MALRMDKVVTVGLWLLLATMVVSICGCTHTITDEGGYTATFGTSLSVIRTSKATGGTTSTETLVVDKALLEWFIANEQTPDLTVASDPPE